jgi:hypothetical protein
MRGSVDETSEEEDDEDADEKEDEEDIAFRRAKDLQRGNSKHPRL